MLWAVLVLLRVLGRVREWRGGVIVTPAAVAHHVRGKHAAAATQVLLLLLLLRVGDGAVTQHMVAVVVP
jgi:hypothetical protein